MESGDSTTITESYLRDLVECPVCFKVPRKFPVIQCQNGHFFCSDCRSRLRKSCPTCRVVLGPEDIRSVLAEKIIVGLTLPCQFQTYGCKKVNKVEKLQRHEKICVHRVVNCPVSNRCNVQVSLSNMANHFKSQHDIIYKYVNHKGIFNVICDVNDEDFDRSQKWVNLYQFDNRYFLVILSHEVDFEETSSWLCFMYILGSPNESGNYEYTLELEDDDELEKVVYVSKQIISIDVPLPDVLDQETGLLMSDKTVRRFRNNDSCLYLTATLRKLSGKCSISNCEADSSDALSPKRSKPNCSKN